MTTTDLRALDARVAKMLGWTDVEWWSVHTVTAWPDKGSRWMHTVESSVLVLLGVALGRGLKLDRICFGYEAAQQTPPEWIGCER